MPLMSLQNHLDMTSKEILWVCTCVPYRDSAFVSHDRYFINRVATRIADLTETILLFEYMGNYDYYLERKKMMENRYFGTVLQLILLLSMRLPARSALKTPLSTKRQYSGRPEC